MATIDIVKTGEFNDESDDGFAQPGETITYTFEINGDSLLPGGGEIVDVIVTDDLVAPIFVGGDDDMDGRLDDDETWFYTAEYAVTAEDIAAGGVNNTACVVANFGFTGPECDDHHEPLTPPPPPPPPAVLGANTPGFWKRWDDIFEHELANAGYTPGDTYESVFGVELDGLSKKIDDPDNLTLHDALCINGDGGGAGGLARHSTAALANAASDEATYGFEGIGGPAYVLDTLDFIDTDDDQILSTGEVIAAVQDVLPDNDLNGRDVEDVKDAFDFLNNALPAVDAMDFIA